MCIRILKESERDGAGRNDSYNNIEKLNDPALVRHRKKNNNNNK